MRDNLYNVQHLIERLLEKEDDARKPENKQLFRDARETIEDLAVRLDDAEEELKRYGEA